MDEEKLLQASGLIAARLEALIGALEQKGFIDAATLDRHLPQNEQERRAIYRQYFEPFFGSS